MPPSTVSATSEPSSPSTREMSGATRPESAKISGGAAPMTESTRWSRCRSSSMWSMIGDNEPTAVRIVSATSAMPKKASRRPRVSDRAPDGWGSGVVTRPH